MGFLGLCRDVPRNAPPVLAFFALLLVAESASAATHPQIEWKARWHLGIDRQMPRRRLEWDRSAGRRLMGGPGSSPPLCRSKCGRCSPCYPVHVPVQPGLSKPMEYYPEAWRCKCGGKLFMP